MKITIIGCGHLGAAIAQGIICSKLDCELSIIDRNQEKLDQFRDLKITLYNKDYSVLLNSDYIILAVRPQAVEEIFELIKSYLDRQVLISVLAGVTVERLQKLSGLSNIFRTMPTIAAQVGQSLIGVYSNSSKSLEVDLILSTFGVTSWVTNEDHINVITAISGSGIAYVFYFINSMLQKAISLGLEEKEASKIIYQTFLGALSLDSNISPEQYVKKIAIPNGTTERAIKLFNEKNLDLIIEDGIQAVLDRARELAK